MPKTTTWGAFTAMLGRAIGAKGPDDVIELPDDATDPEAVALEVAPAPEARRAPEAADARALREQVEQLQAALRVETEARAAEAALAWKKDQEAKARAFAGSLSAKVFPNEAPGIEAAYFRAAQDDRDHPRAAGEPSRVADLEALYAARPEHGVLQSQATGAPLPAGATITPSDLGSPAPAGMSAERRRQIAAANSAKPS